VTLHDALGRTVRSLFDGTLDAGVHHCEAEVPEETVVEIGPLGYVRMELPGGRWQQGIFLPGARTDSSSTHRLERDRSLAGDKPVPPLPPTPRGQK
jgi:hypothetical protein